MSQRADPVIGRRAEPVHREQARAKINLALHVLGRRADGYHDLDSLVAFADIGDEIALVDGGEGLMVEGEFADALSATPDDHNLALRAARALAGATGVAMPGVGIRLTKALPIGAGLGGGSADAAAVLRLLVEEAGMDLPPDTLDAIAAGLGADVPMCLRSSPLVARGKGEIIVPAIGIPALSLVLVWPAAPVSTAEVFARLAGRADPALPALPDEGFASAGDFVRWLRFTRNSLEDTARDCAPVIGHALQALVAAPGCMLARMSGSGSTCFGIFPFPDAAEHAARIIRHAEPGWWVEATTTGAS